MNATKIMLKALVATQMMQSLVEKKRGPTEAEVALLLKIDAEIAAAEGADLLDQDIDEVFPDLIEAIDTLEDEL